MQNNYVFFVNSLLTHFTGPPRAGRIPRPRPRPLTGRGITRQQEEKKQEQHNTNTLYIHTHTPAPCVWYALGVVWGVLWVCVLTVQFVNIL